MKSLRFVSRGPLYFAWLSSTYPSIEGLLCKTLEAKPHVSIANPSDGAEGDFAEACGDCKGDFSSDKLEKHATNWMDTL